MSGYRMALCVLAVAVILAIGLVIRLALVHHFGWYGWFM